jgi:DNA-binding NarL/FixJ family response regulator
LTWDNIAVKYAVSVTTVKRWFKQNNLRKFVVAQKRKSWSVKEEEQLLSLYSTGFLVRQISAELHRSECSVKKRIQRLCNDKIRSRYRRYEKCA